MGCVGLLFRSGRSRDRNYCLALVHDTCIGLTCAFVHRLEQNEIEQLVKCLLASREHVRHPALLPLFLIELKVNFFAKLPERRALALEEIELATFGGPPLISCTDYIRLQLLRLQAWYQFSCCVKVGLALLCRYFWSHNPRFACLVSYGEAMTQGHI